MNTYEIRPRKDRRGCTLTGPLLSYPLWYGSVGHAESYVFNHLARYSTGELVIYDERGGEVARKVLPQIE